MVDDSLADINGCVDHDKFALATPHGVRVCGSQGGAHTNTRCELCPAAGRQSHLSRVVSFDVVAMMLQVAILQPARCSLASSIAILIYDHHIAFLSSTHPEDNDIVLLPCLHTLRPLQGVTQCSRFWGGKAHDDFVSFVTAVCILCCRRSNVR